jgi:ABC-type transport system involved in multi-copper enzyme maturation permease subunit
MNPVLAREITQRMRRRRAVIVVSAYLLILSLIMVGLYKGAVSASSIRDCSDTGQCFSSPNALAMASAGRPIFHWLLFFVLMLVCFIVPGVTSGAIASERERQTLVPLQVTLLSPLSILVGKLLASLAFTLLLLVATLPLMSVAYAIGGVSFGEIVRGLAIIVVVAAAMGCLSIACSAAFRRVQAATVASYAAVFVLVIGTLIAFGMSFFIGRGQSRLAIELLVGNPFVATADVLGGIPMETAGGLGSPFSPIQRLLEAAAGQTANVPVARPEMPQEPMLDGQGMVAVEPSPVAPVVQPVGFWGRVPFWVVTLGFYGLVGALSLWFAAGRIRAPSGRDA